MSKIQKFELDIDGLRELMKSSEMQSILGEAVQSVQGTANGMVKGGQFGSDVREASYVAIGTVYAADSESAKATYRDNVLEKALGSSGLPRNK